MGVPTGTISVQANAMFDHFIAVMDHASLANARQIAAESPLRDPDDASVWATAVVGGADYVISHNTRHFPPLVRGEVLIGDRAMSAARHIHQGIEFLTAIGFIADVLAEDAASILGATLPTDGVVRRRRAVPVRQ